MTAAESTAPRGERGTGQGSPRTRSGRQGATAETEAAAGTRAAPPAPAPPGPGGLTVLGTVLGAPFSGRTWRTYLYILTSLPITAVTFAWSVATLTTGVGLLVTFVGVPLLAAGLAGCRLVGRMERARARALLDADVAEPEPVRALQHGHGLWARVSAVLRSGVSWRHLLHTLLHLPWATLVFALTLALWSYGWAMLLYPAWKWIFPRFLDQPGLQLWEGADGESHYLDSGSEVAVTSAAGLVLVLLTPWLARGLTQLDRVLATGLLGPSRMATRMWELESDRGTVVDTAAADLRRIERDLHDGAQARLVALAMDLGLAKEKLLEDPQAAAAMVDEAHGEVKLAIQELRDLARGIHPAILTDRGLGPALSALAARCAVPVTVTVDLDRRPAQAIEGMAYFTVSELLQNISKHSAAARAWVEVWRTEDRLLLQVRDDGKGGARAAASGGSEAGGSGLAGLAERLDAVDGLLLLDSPRGGPTTVTAELPWR